MRKSIFLIFVIIFSLGKNCVAMQRNPFCLEEGQDIAIAMPQERVCQEPVPSFIPACKQCGCDALKVAVGASSCAVSFVGLFFIVASEYNRVNLGESYEVGSFEKIMSSGPVAFTVAVCAGASGLYTAYQTGKFLADSWYLKRIIKNKLFDRLSK